MIKKIQLLPLIILPLLASCGFHFAGMQVASENLSPLYIQTSNLSRQIDKNLRKSFADAGVEIAERRSSATAILEVFDEEIDRRVLSVSSGANVREFELRYLVMFALKKADGTDMIKPQKVEMFRDYSYDEFSILGKEAEDDTIRRELAKDAVHQIMRRIQTSVKLPTRGT